MQVCGMLVDKAGLCCAKCRYCISDRFASASLREDTAGRRPWRLSFPAAQHRGGVLYTWHRIDETIHNSVMLAAARSDVHRQHHLLQLSTVQLYLLSRILKRTLTAHNEHQLVGAPASLWPWRCWLAFTATTGHGSVIRHACIQRTAEHCTCTQDRRQIDSNSALAIDETACQNQTT